MFSFSLDLDFGWCGVAMAHKKGSVFCFLWPKSLRRDARSCRWRWENQSRRAATRHHCTFFAEKNQLNTDVAEITRKTYKQTKNPVLKSGWQNLRKDIEPQTHKNMWHKARDTKHQEKRKTFHRGRLRAPSPPRPMRPFQALPCPFRRDPSFDRGSPRPIVWPWVAEARRMMAHA